MPILGTIASQVPANLPTNSFESIATVSADSGGSYTLSFSSIPSTYKHLQIRGIGVGMDNTNVRIRFNGDSSSNYAYHALRGGPGYGGTPGVDVATNANGIIMYDQQLGGSTYYNTVVCDIHDYTSTSKNKTISALSGCNTTTSGFVYLYSGVWYKTPEAITSISIFPYSNFFYSGTTFSLYGVKGQ